MGGGKRLCVWLLAFSLFLDTFAYDGALKTNLLYWATTTPNIGTEWRLSDRLSLGATLGYNAFNFPNKIGSDGQTLNPKLHHWLVMPELKAWRNQPLQGGYLGLHFLGGAYNVGGLKFPHFLDDRRYKGWAIGGGISWGHVWTLRKNWSFEASVGVGYIYTKYDKYRCGACGEKYATARKHYVGPTKIALSVVYRFDTHPKVKVVETEHITYAVKRDTVYIDRPVMLPDNKAPIIATLTIHLNYPVDKWTVYPEYNGNREELARLDSVLAPIIDNPDRYVIDEIVINGYASPEATYRHNMILSDNRARAVRDYLREHYGLTDATAMIYNGYGEDWQGLRDAVAHSDMPDRDDVIGIIDNVGLFAGREKQIMNLRGGKTYNYMLKNLFPPLRRMELRITYHEK